MKLLKQVNFINVQPKYLLQLVILSFAIFIASYLQAPVVHGTFIPSSRGVFINSGQFLGNSTTSDIALGDLDNDGDLDVYVCNIGQRINGSDISGEPDEIWLNNGIAIFTDSSQRIGNLPCEDVGLADIDDDGDLDAITVNGFGNHPNQLWLNNGLGVFTDSNQILGMSDSKSVGLADFDNDMDVDIYNRISFS